MVVDVETNLVQDYWSWQAGFGCQLFFYTHLVTLVRAACMPLALLLFDANRVTVGVQEVTQLLQYWQGVNQRWHIHFLAKHF